MEISIRTANQIDTSSILGVIENSYAKFKRLIPKNKTFSITLEEIRDLIIDTHNMVWLAIHENSIVGVAAAFIFDNKNYHLKLLFVSDNFQKQGIGEILLNTFEKYGKEKGCCLLTTNYQKWAPWSGQFYLKHGYKEYVPGDEFMCFELIKTVDMRIKIGKLNNDDKCFIWKML